MPNLTVALDDDHAWFVRLDERGHMTPYNIDPVPARELAGCGDGYLFGYEHVEHFRSAFFRQDHHTRGG